MEESHTINKKQIKIGTLSLDGPFVLAPMAGVTNWPFRWMAQSEGASLTYSEMASAVALVYRGKGTLRLLKNPQRQHPFGVQLFGKDPKHLAEAARIAELEHGASLIDLNFACPARKVIRSGHGAAILQDPDLALRISEEVIKAISIPLTVKTRPGYHPPQDWEEATIFTLAKGLEALGVAAITIHPRYASQGFTGEADWSITTRLSHELKIPVIGSGDVKSAEEAIFRLNGSGASLIMLGRATRGRPWIFRECLKLLNGEKNPQVGLRERLNYASTHARLLYSELGVRAVFPLRTVLGWYLKELPRAASFRDRINHEEDFETQLSILSEAFAEAEGSLEKEGRLEGAPPEGLPTSQ
ncbi:MAG: tRNA-dihydrouridine synthase [Deltaproteobacteria bacterium]|jgi:nifR3 family TIM-barrel protein|nr:tRNA-dihydrouridine synthase [Deltaproteobacteria bacterium]